MCVNNEQYNICTYYYVVINIMYLILWSHFSTVINSYFYMYYFPYAIFITFFFYTSRHLDFNFSKFLGTT